MISNAAAPSIDAEITWLLHRAAQRMHIVTGEQAEKYGIALRDYIVLSALHKTPGLTQIELANVLGLDKTTLMSQIDRLERLSLVLRGPDPRDRRARIPVITDTGSDARAQVATASAEVEQNVLAGFDPAQVAIFRQMLYQIIGDSKDPGSCL